MTLEETLLEELRDLSKGELIEIILKEDLGDLSCTIN